VTHEACFESPLGILSPASLGVAFPPAGRAASGTTHPSLLLLCCRLLQVSKWRQWPEERPHKPPLEQTKSKSFLAPTVCDPLSVHLFFSGPAASSFFFFRINMPPGTVNLIGPFFFFTPSSRPLCDACRVSICCPIALCFDHRDPPQRLFRRALLRPSPIRRTRGVT